MSVFKFDFDGNGERLFLNFIRDELGIPATNLSRLTLSSEWNQLASFHESSIPSQGALSISCTAYDVKLLY